MATHRRVLSVARVLGALGIILLGVLPSAAATLYVNRGNAQCSDAGSGTSSIPYCTIGKGATVAVAGDTVLVSSGTYPEYVKVANSGTSSLPIVIRAADGANVTVSGQTRGFEISSRSWITISRFTVSTTTSYGIYIQNSSNITLSGNRVTAAGQPVSGGTQPGIYVNSTTDSTIAGNTIDHNTDAGIYLTNGSTRITVVGNEASFNARGYTRAAPGIDVRSSGNTIKGNICHDNEDSGIQIYAYGLNIPSPNNLIVNNLCYNNGDHGIDINSAGSQRVIGNTVFNNATAAINVEGPSSGTLIQNNISADNAINGTRTRGNLRVDSASTPGTTLDYDHFYLSQSGQIQIIWGGTSYATLADFKSAIGQEAHGLEADPRFVAPGSGNFHLNPGSPAIDSANSAVSGETNADLENHPRTDDLATNDTGLGPPRSYDDRGAYEYQPAGAVCGNGLKEQGEQCDGASLGGATCQTQGFYCATGSGLACKADCTFNTSACVSGSCGDSTIQSACGETCDRTALGGATCSSKGCTGGTPTCTSTCTVSYASCTGCPVCGNGIKETGEQCDGAALGSATCQTQGFYCATGSGLACKADCTFNTSACVSGSCGDGTVQSACGEACDKTALGGQTCQTQGFYCSTGTGLACNSSCQFSTTSCVSGSCGDGTVQSACGEQCDGAALGGATCNSLGYYCSTGSGLACGATCAYSTGACISGSCGDGVIQSACGEVCDKTALGGQTCQTQGFDLGTLACGSGCRGFNTSGCIHCNNNGVCDSGENCNGCPGDCFKSAPRCGNGKCETANGENCLTCPQDCNGLQNRAKFDRYCCGSGGGVNPVSCSDARCTASGRQCTSISTPTSCCGDGTCQSNETTSTCAVDCGP